MKNTFLTLTREQMNLPPLPQPPKPKRKHTRCKITHFKNTEGEFDEVNSPVHPEYNFSTVQYWQWEWCEDEGQWCWEQQFYNGEYKDCLAFINRNRLKLR